jgi:valyl-tRNA synthetase
MSVYLTGKMPFEYVYFHPLVLGADGQKMSKSLGNSVSLNTYLDVYGADVTRMSLVSYMDQAHDFVFEESNLMQYQEFVQDVWRVARAYNVILDHNVTAKSAGRLNDVDFAIVRTLRGLGKSVGGDIERHFYARAQEKVVAALPEIEQLVQRAAATGSVSAASAFLQMWQQYLIVLHPFAPHVSEAVYQSIPDKQSDLLATAYWPR